MPSALVVRTSAFFGPWDAHNFVTAAVRLLEAGEPVRAASDLVVSPTYVPDLVDAVLDLVIDDARGIWHVTNDTATTWAALAERTAAATGRSPGLVQPCRSCDLPMRALRPRYSALGTGRGLALPPLDDALERYLREQQVA